MEKLLQHDKQGVTEMVGYVLLVLIAVAVSVGVYVFLKLQLPKGEIRCEKDATLVVEDATCKSISLTKKQITITLTNKGLYKVDGAYVRLSPLGKKAKTWINDPIKVGDGNFYLYNVETNKKGLQPGEKLSFIIPPADIVGSSSGSGSGASNIYELEVQPAAFTSKGRLGACETILSQEIQCA
ncbi:MAG: hypothetical protein AABY00_03150 [Nanoarchaeota archaeon]